MWPRGDDVRLELAVEVPAQLRDVFGQSGEAPTAACSGMLCTAVVSFSGALALYCYTSCASLLPQATISYRDHHHLLMTRKSRENCPNFVDSQVLPSGVEMAHPWRPLTNGRRHPSGPEVPLQLGERALPPKAKLPGIST